MNKQHIIALSTLASPRVLRRAEEATRRSPRLRQSPQWRQPPHPRPQCHTVIQLHRRRPRPHLRQRRRRFLASPTTPSASFWQVPTGARCTASPRTPTARRRASTAAQRAWPPVVVDDSLDLSTLPSTASFSIVDRPDGTKQLKAGKWPLYYFSGDAAAGEANGQGSGGSLVRRRPERDVDQVVPHLHVEHRIGRARRGSSIPRLTSYDHYSDDRPRRRLQQS